MINLLDPTPLTPTEALILVLNAEDYVSNDERIPLGALAAALGDLAAAEYLIRKEALQLSMLVNKAEAKDERICDECFHPVRLHGKYGCEVERDRYESGYAPMAVPCGCRAWEHIEEKSNVQ